MLIGFLAVFPLYSLWLDVGPGPDANGIQLMKVLIAVFCVGVVGGILSYYVPTVSARTRQIREHCDAVFGIAIDPAQVRFTAAVDLANIPYAKTECDFPAHKIDVASREVQRWQLRCQLVHTRCQIALGKDEAAAERQTDQLLLQLRDDNHR